MAGRFSVEAVFKGVDRLSAPVTRMQNRVQRMTRSMSRGLRGADKMLGNMGRSLASGATKIAQFGGLIVSALGIAGVMAMNKLADSADALAKRSRRLEFPIDELQQWQFVAEQAGISSDEFDKSLEKFTKTLGETKAGTGTLVTILKKINPALLDQLNTVTNSSDALDVYLSALRQTEDQTMKYALATAAFGRQGGKFLNITELSTDAVAALRAEMAENGLVTKEQAEAAEAYNDAINSLKRALTGVLQNTLLPLMPALTKIIRQAREWAITNKDLIATRVREYLLKIRDAGLRVISFIKEINAKHNLVEVFTKTVEVMAAASRYLIENGSTVLRLLVAIVALSLGLKALIAVMTIVNLLMMLNPVGLVVLAFVALVGAIAAAVVYWDDVVAAFESLPGPVKSAIEFILLPITTLIDMAKLVIENWEPIKQFFADLWSGIVSTFDAAVAHIMSIVNKVKAAAAEIVNTISSIGTGVGDFFGFSDDEDDAAEPMHHSPGARVARSIEEQRTTSTSEVTIRDETNRAEVTSGKLGPGLNLMSSGAF